MKTLYGTENSQYIEIIELKTTL
uniref:Uncharacterized protein n=1 Tax=Serratia phage Kevin TaxID=3161161 RepID=A0AAU8KXK5_9CAUD